MSLSFSIKSFSIKPLRRDARECIDMPTYTARFNELDDKLDVYDSEMLCVYLREIGRFSPEPSRSHGASPHNSESVICAQADVRHRRLRRNMG